MVFGGAVAAESHDCSTNKKSKYFLTNFALVPGGAPKHEISQFVRIDSVSSANPNFDGAEQLIYRQTDHLSGTGSHRGYSDTVQKSGDHVYYKWEGHDKTTSKEGGGWELAYDGHSELTGGSGKFANISGSGTYRGNIDSLQGAAEKVTCRATY